MTSLLTQLHRSVAASLAAMVAAALTACTAGPAGDQTLGTSGDRAFAQGAISRLTNTDSGLEVRKWLVPDETRALAAAFENFPEADAGDEHTTALLRANGLRLLRLNHEQVETLHASLGELAMDATAWFGQVTEWRPMQSRQVPGGGATLAADGRVDRFSGGALQLAIRCWTVPMEEEPVVQVEMALHQRLPRSQRDLRRLVELGAGDDVRPISTLRVDIPLSADEVLVLATLLPEDELQDQAAAPTDVDDTEPAEIEQPMMVGPDVEAPPAIGPWLLDTEQPQSLRGVYVFRARIPEALYPNRTPSVSEETGQSL